MFIKYIELFIYNVNNKYVDYNKGGFYRGKYYKLCLM